MLKLASFSLLLSAFLSTTAWAEDEVADEQIHTQIEKNIVYCNIQTFDKEAYVLNVIASGTPATVLWQFDVLQKHDLWLDEQVVSVRLGRQVIPDLVTQRWLMRDLSGGVVKYTNDAHEAMRFLTRMDHVAVVDVSILDQAFHYTLAAKMFLHEGREEKTGWWTTLTNWGDTVGIISLDLGEGMNHAQ
ncbi:MAG: DUF4390 domain-containing protein [Ghiorsea sp.]